MKEYFKEQLCNLSSILYFAKIDLAKSYRGAFLGWFWAIFKPTFTIFVYYFTFTIGLRTSKVMFGYPYFLWLISGIIPWFFINDVLHQGSESIRKYDYLVTKVKFPVSIIPTFSTLSKFIVHLILTTLVILIFALSKYELSIYIIQLPFYMILMFIFLNFLNLGLSSLSAISKDFFNFIKSTIFAIFWLSGVIWDPSLINIEWLKKILFLNPITFIVNGYRNSFVKHIWFWKEPTSLLFFLLLTLGTIIFSIAIYKRIKKDIPDLL